MAAISPEIIRVLTEQTEILKQVLTNEKAPAEIKLDVATTIGTLTLLIAFFKDAK
jgi:hypothetical protein